MAFLDYDMIQTSCIIHAGMRGELEELSFRPYV